MQSGGKLEPTSKPKYTQNGREELKGSQVERKLLQNQALERSKLQVFYVYFSFCLDFKNGHGALVGLTNLKVQVWINISFLKS